MSAPASDEGHFYYLAHQPVVKLSSATTKIRVVFDASAKDSKGQSLNDSLLTGEKLQKDIFSILLKFRIHKIVFTADIKQMYRQIWIEPKHTNYQRILWRFSPFEDVQDYRLKTVTFGVNSSPFLALRTIQQLIAEGKASFPLAAKVLETDIFVDDVVTGCSSVESALQLQQELVTLCSFGGFELRKWSSNSQILLDKIASSVCHDSSFSFDFEKDMVLKILGLQWVPLQDYFTYKVDILERPCTKRHVLSELAKIFDPLGFLSPLTFFAKYLIQQLWVLGIGWDEKPPDRILEIWENYKSQLHLISSLNVPRRITCDDVIYYELHGFCDASEKGYAAVAYLRALFHNSQYRVSLVSGKSKISPLKRISLPRLELCAAVLLSDLIAAISKTLENNLKFCKLYAWSDSMVTISWIKSSPHRWKTFVANRVSHIQDILPPACWNYVESNKNPADCASRGLLPEDLVNHSLWWAGPPWLKEPQNCWPSFNHSVEPSSLSIKEEEKVTPLRIAVSIDFFDSLLSKYSSLRTIQRVLVYISRFVHNLRHPKDKLCGYIITNELYSSLMLLIRNVQAQSFEHEIYCIQSGKTLSKSMRKLSPFLDSSGVLRVGGRLGNSGLNFSQKHSVLLPRQHRLTELIIEQYHKQYLHVGLQTLQFLLSQNFWILSARRAISKVIAKCIKCFRNSPKISQPPMGQLPSVRVNQAKPFQVVGVDYAGPLFITLGKHRGVKSQKAYICLFVCFTTKALHVELVSDLASHAFLAALRRFIAGRGRCNQIFSDRGTNFVGAKSEILKCMEDACVEENLTWTFNPPSSPHFDGLWEAGVKSFKTHLFRVIGDQRLTYEELYTVLVQIEALLSSRPLCPLSSDPNDLSVLTPGHFLTLAPLSSIPDPDLTSTNVNRLTRWQLIQRIQQDFWRRWHREYLHQLHQKLKWNETTSSIVPGTLVLVKQENNPPLKWPLARVEKCHLGADGICRVVTLKTQRGQLQRPVVKICPLPLN